MLYNACGGELLPEGKWHSSIGYRQGRGEIILQSPLLVHQVRMLMLMLTMMMLLVMMMTMMMMRMTMGLGEIILRSRLRGYPRSGVRGWKWLTKVFSSSSSYYCNYKSLAPSSFWKIHPLTFHYKDLSSLSYLRSSSSQDSLNRPPIQGPAL